MAFMKVALALRFSRVAHFDLLKSPDCSSIFLYTDVYSLKSRDVKYGSVFISELLKPLQ